MAEKAEFWGSSHDSRFSMLTDWGKILIQPAAEAVTFIYVSGLGLVPRSAIAPGLPFISFPISFLIFTHEP